MSLIVHNIVPEIVPEIVPKNVPWKWDIEDVEAVVSKLGMILESKEPLDGCNRR